MRYRVSPDSAIDPLVTSQSGVCCKKTSVSHLVVKLHILYSVLIVAGRECIVAFGSVSVPRSILGVGVPSVLGCCLGA